MLAWKTARRLIVSIVGVTVLLIGLALVVLPGPAFVVIPLGLAILATEFLWAQRLLGRVKDRVRGFPVIGTARCRVEQNTHAPPTESAAPKSSADEGPSTEVRLDVAPRAADGKLPSGLVDPVQQPPPRPPNKT